MCADISYEDLSLKEIKIIMLSVEADYYMVYISVNKFKKLIKAYEELIKDTYLTKNSILWKNFQYIYIKGVNSDGEDVIYTKSEYSDKITFRKIECHYEIKFAIDSFAEADKYKLHRLRSIQLFNRIWERKDELETLPAKVFFTKTPLTDTLMARRISRPKPGTRSVQEPFGQAVIAFL